MKANNKVNKTLRFDPELLEKAKKVLGYKTYTQTIEETLKTSLQNKQNLNKMMKYHGQFKTFRSLYT